MSVYVNGTKVVNYSTKDDALVETPHFNNWHIGKPNHRDVKFSTFMLDELVFMDKKLADAEVKSLYESYSDRGGLFVHLI